MATWTNYAGNVSVEADLSQAPKDLNGLEAAIAAAKAAGREARPFGSGWSFSRTAVTDDGRNGYMINMQGLCTPKLPLPPTLPGAPPGLVYAQAGVQLHRLNMALDVGNAPDPAWAIPTMGGSGGQTLGGVIATGSHGCDFNLPPVADMVAAIHLVGPDGTNWWLEEGQQFDSGKLPAFLQAGNAAQASNAARVVKVQQSAPGKPNPLMRAALVMPQGLGIVYAYVLKTVPVFGLMEVRVNDDWAIQRSALLSGAAFTNTQPPNLPYRGYELVINPIELREPGHNDCIVTKRFSIDNIPLPNPSLPACAFIRFMGDQFIQLAEADFDDLADDPDKVSDMSWFALQKARPTESDRIGRSYEVMDGCSYNPDGSISDGGYRGLSTEVFFDATPGAGIQTMVTALDTLLATLNHDADNGQPLFGYIGVRFTGKTNAALGMQRWARTGSIELAGLGTSLGSSKVSPPWLPDTFARYVAVLTGAGGLPHWGQFENLTAARVQEVYGADLAAWQAAKKTLTSGASTFTTGFDITHGLA